MVRRSISHGFRGSSSCHPYADKFGYLTTSAIRNATKLPFTPASMSLLDQLGELMGNPGRETAPDSAIPVGFTYIGQSVDHDITLDVSSRLNAAVDAETVNNMRSPALDLDSVYGDGPPRSVLTRVPIVGSCYGDQVATGQQY